MSQNDQTGNAPSRRSGDADIISDIGAMVERERALRAEISAGGAGEEGAREELLGIEVRLDQCWDLLRQRRARQEFGENPDDAQVRPADEVENYRS
ncbi:DUF2630 family protein [Phaeacidiphilus oryzae]|jgi:hypothetical protein|uniref:DUF2630 family protein n=1 Tax=Phaeacidiphilus oryzae TaxID=348818 RepID=UPI00068EE60A|nr:DUF2630 family protein [Phaeacidiphilus oryzae]